MTMPIKITINVGIKILLAVSIPFFTPKEITTIAKARKIPEYKMTSQMFPEKPFRSIGVDEKE